MPWDTSSCTRPLTFGMLPRVPDGRRPAISRMSSRGGGLPRDHLLRIVAATAVPSARPPSPLSSWILKQISHELAALFRVAACGASFQDVAQRAQPVPVAAVEAALAEAVADGVVWSYPSHRVSQTLIPPLLLSFPGEPCLPA